MDRAVFVYTTWPSLVEAETHLGDFQAVERRIGAKARDLGADRVVLLLADTRHNRTMLNTIPAIRQRFPVDQRAWFRAIANSEDPGGDDRRTRHR